MVKLLSALVLATLLVPATGARFEKDGVRIGDALVQGPALELKQIEAGVVLASGNVVEPISTELAVEVATGRTLILEPGVRASRSDAGYAISTHAGKALRVEADGKVRKLGAAETLSLTAEGWAIAGEVLPAGSVRIGLQQQGQGDPDADLEAMKRAASRIQSRRRTSRTGAQQRMRRVFPIDPTAANEATDSQTLKALTQVTPIGF